MTETKTPKSHPMELTAEEVRLFLDAASSYANEFVRSGETVSVVPELAEAWERSASTLPMVKTSVRNQRSNSLISSSD
jgi:hypothetical protein